MKNAEKTAVSLETQGVCGFGISFYARCDFCGEHAIGFAKMGYLKKQYGDTPLELIKGIKNVFDLKNILNPGKIFLLHRNLNRQLLAKKIPC